MGFEVAAIGDERALRSLVERTARAICVCLCGYTAKAAKVASPTLGAQVVVKYRI